MGFFSYVFGFFNETHCDKCDKISPEYEATWFDCLTTVPDNRMSHQSISDKIMDLYYFFGHIPVPTFCGYSYQWPHDQVDRSSVIFQYFDYPELGIAKRIKNGSGHWMLASTFFHRTSVCIQHYSDQVFWKANLNNSLGFNLFAWGKLSKDERAARLMQNIDDERVVDDVEIVGG